MKKFLLNYYMDTIRTTLFRQTQFAEFEQIAYEWARIPHFYNAFYVYKYATGIISAISIVKRILTEGEPAVKDYFDFLSSGGCTDPVSILKKAGVDLTTKAPFDAAMEEFKNTLEEFKSLLD